MGKYTDLYNNPNTPPTIGADEDLPVNQAWNGNTGAWVENFIRRSLDDLDNGLINSLSYDGDQLELYLYNKSGEVIASGLVSPAVPNYNHSLLIEGVYINDVLQTGDTIQCLLGSKIAIRVKYNLTAENSLTGKINHVSGRQKLFVKIGNGGYVEILEGITSKDESQDIDITNLYSQTTVSNVSIRTTTYAQIEEDLKTISATTKSTLYILNPSINYAGSQHVVNGFAEFLIQNGGGINYLLYYSVNGGPTSMSTTNMITLDQAGLNTISVYAAVAGNINIKTQTINILVINIKGQDTFDNILATVNEVSELFSNWEYSKLYKLTLYAKGQDVENVTIRTALTNTADSNDTYFDKLKEINISDILENGIYEEDICYFFGMDITSNITASLIVQLENEDIIAFDDFVQLTILNDSTFTYTKGYSYAFDQFDPDNSNLVTKEVLSNIESPDGLLLENSLSVFRISARDYLTPALSIDLASELTNSGFTFEMDYKSYNISDLNLPVLKLGRFVMYPTEFNWNFATDTPDSVDKTARSSLFLEDERTHVLIEVVPNFKAVAREVPEEVSALKDTTINIVRIFINGGIDREFRYTSLSDFYDGGFKLEIAPKTSDIDIYGIRIYNKALSFEELSNNYMSTMSDINAKKEFLYNNDIVARDSKGDSYISYNLAKDKYNTLLYILPKGTKYPHLFNATKDTKIEGCTLFVNYVNHAKLPIEFTNELINKCSGRFTNVTVKGLGTSAMKYYWYNISSKGKFTSKGCYDEIEQNYIEPVENSELLFNSSVYYMPTDPNTGIKKLVGKTNYASSMQSHKIGATRAYHDLWEAIVDKSTFSGPEEYVGRKAVLEEPFLAFYIESDQDDLTNYTPADVDLLLDEVIKFATFLTWGSGKGDDATSGYDENTTPGYLMLEGAENNGKLPNFLAPWMPNCITLNGETYKTLGLDIDDLGKVFYNEFDSLDVNFGLKEDSETELTLEAQETLLLFIKAYNFCYLHTINFEKYTSTTSINDDSTVDNTKKYYITNAAYNDPSRFSAKLWDVLRYDQYSGMWVPAGLPKLDEDGNLIKHSTISNAAGDLVYDYEVFNLKEFCNSIAGTGIDNIDRFKLILIDDFKKGSLENFGTYFHVDDILFHLAFIKLFAGTDNRAKNTYFKMVSKDHKILLLLDDLDTLLATDNRGLLKKPYFLIEPSSETEELYKKMWGGSSAFFELVDIAYKSEINTMLKNILTLFNVNQEPTIHNWMQKYFYYVQEYFPAVSYNYTARLIYESPLIFYENLGSVGITWQNNGQDPISQAHGSCLLSEKEFMKKRLIMFLSLAQVSNIFGPEAMGINIKSTEDGASSGTDEYTIKITPYLYLYLGYNLGSTTALYSPDRQISDIAKEVTVKLEANTPLYSILGARYIKKFDNFSKIKWSNSIYNLTAKRITEMIAGVEIGVELKFKPSTITLETPVLTKLDVRNISTLTNLDLSSNRTPKLEEVYMLGTSIKRVTLPAGSRLKSVYFPKSLEALEIINNPGLLTVNFENYSNISEVNINCSKCGLFDVSQFLYDIFSSNNNLESITLREVDLYITEEHFNKLLNTKNSKILGKGIIRIMPEDYFVTGIKSDNAVISYDTVLNICNKLPSINSTSDGVLSNDDLTIYYKPKEIESISLSESVYIYSPNGLYPDGGYMTDIIGKLGFSASSGNNIIIVNGKPSIVYSLNSSGTLFSSSYGNGAVSLDLTTDTVNMSKEYNGSVTVYLKVTTSNKVLTTTTLLYFTWIKPNSGDFVYIDGTYSSTFNSNKTLVGLLYDVVYDSDDLTSGTAYLIGKERLLNGTKGYQIGVSPVTEVSNWSEFTQGNYTSLDVRNTVVSLGNLQASNGLIKDGNYWNVVVGDSSVHYYTERSSTKLSLLLGITDSQAPIKDSNLIEHEGKYDTNIYVLFVDSKIVPTLKEDFGYDRYISHNSSLNRDSISSIDNLNSMLNILNNGDNPHTGTALYPYFYSAYLYEPTPKSNEVISEHFVKGKWYMPSIDEVLYIAYQKLLGVRNPSTSANIANEIETSSGIFGSALSKMKSANFIEDWNRLFTDNCNLVSTTVYDTNNYANMVYKNVIQESSYYSTIPTKALGYKVIASSYNPSYRGGTVFTYESEKESTVLSLIFPTATTSGGSASLNVERCSFVSGIPFCEFTFNKYSNG